MKYLYLIVFLSFFSCTKTRMYHTNEAGRFIYIIPEGWKQHMDRSIRSDLSLMNENTSASIELMVNKDDESPEKKAAFIAEEITSYYKDANIIKAADVKINKYTAYKVDYELKEHSDLRFTTVGIYESSKLYIVAFSAPKSQYSQEEKNLQLFLNSLQLQN